MKSATLIAAASLIMIAPALGQDVPFAEPPASQSGQFDASMLPSLGDIMVDTQVRHIKLWYAAKAGNWSLVSYELDRISESLRKAAILYRAIPVEYVTAMNKPLTDMRDAAATKASDKFSHGYAAFTAGCNTCHMAGGVGFIHIQTPTSLPFTDEIYSKVGKP